MESVVVDACEAEETRDAAKGAWNAMGGVGSGMRSGHLTVLSTAHASRCTGGCGRIDASSARSASIRDLVLRIFLARDEAESAGTESLLPMAGTRGAT